MTEYVYQKFPDRAAFIRTLRNKDTAFREICDDYEEMRTWLAVQSGSIDPNALEYVEALEIIRDLEDEIKKVLRDKGR